MAILSRSREARFAGGVGRWIGADEARTLVERIAGFDTAAELADWLQQAAFDAGVFGATAKLYYRARLGYLDNSFNRDAFARDLIVGTAARRRRDAVRAYLDERGVRHVPGRQARFELCATCDRPLGEHDISPFYCDEHRDDETVELDGLLGHGRRRAPEPTSASKP